jgi:hypothetical protein
MSKKDPSADKLTRQVAERAVAAQRQRKKDYKNPSDEQMTILRYGKNDPTYNNRTGMVYYGGKLKGTILGRDAKPVKKTIA